MRLVKCPEQNQNIATALNFVKVVNLQHNFSYCKNLYLKFIFILPKFISCDIVVSLLLCMGAMLRIKGRSRIALV